MSVFSRQDYFRVLTDSLNYCIQNKGLVVHAYVLMPNHFHLICSALAGLSAVMRDMKKHTSKLLAQKIVEDGRHLWLTAMERAAGNTSQVRIWDEAFHPEQIYTASVFFSRN